MIDKLPEDIVVYMSKHGFLDIKHFCLLRRVNKTLKKHIDANKRIILTYEMKFINPNLKLQYMVNFIDERLGNIYSDMNHKLVQNMNSRYRNVHLCIKDNYELISISYNDNVNKIFHKMFDWFLNHNSVYMYPCEFDIYVFYHLIHIDNLINVNTNHLQNMNFIRCLSKDNPTPSTKGKFDSIIRKYFTTLNVYNVYMRIDDLHVSSTYAVTLGTLKKLMGVKILDLSNSEFLKRNDDDIYNTMSQICIFRFYRQNDDLVGYNYNEIKQFLKEKAPQLYNFMLLHEKLIVRNKVHYHGTRYQNIYNSLIKQKEKYNVTRYFS